MVDIQDHHLGGATSLAAGLDHSRERVESLHERDRAGRSPAALQSRVALANGGEVRTRPRSPLEEHAFGLRQVQDRFQGIVHRVDEARRALRAVLVGVQRGDTAGSLVPGPAIASRLLADADIEPDRRIECGLLREHEVGQVVTEALDVVCRREISSFGTPIGDRIDHSVDEIRKAALAARRAERTVEVLASHDVCRRLRPLGGHFHVALLEHGVPLGIRDHGCPLLPIEDAVGRLAFWQAAREVALEANAASRRDRWIAGRG